MTVRRSILRAVGIAAIALALWIAVMIAFLVVDSPLASTDHTGGSDLFWTAMEAVYLLVLLMLGPGYALSDVLGIRFPTGPLYVVTASIGALLWGLVLAAVWAISERLLDRYRRRGRGGTLSK